MTRHAIFRILNPHPERHQSIQIQLPCAVQHSQRLAMRFLRKQYGTPKNLATRKVTRIVFFQPLSLDIVHEHKLSSQLYICKHAADGAAMRRHTPISRADHMPRAIREWLR